MRRIVVFAGPSLPPGTRPPDPTFDYFPPAGAGDILRLLDDPPDAICLVDGYFDRRPAPWHKELLLAMSRGAALFGAASMGALRAAELHAHGMIGVGAIFRAYRDGRLTGDDEVACIHAPGELGWAPLTVPMVEVRATLLAARRARVIDRVTARTARALAHNLHFSTRDWPAVERAWTEAGALPPDIARRVRALHVRLKHTDAVACLHVAASSPGAPPRAPAPPRTCYLDALAFEVSPASVAVMSAAIDSARGAGKG